MFSPSSEPVCTTPGRASRNEFDFMRWSILLQVGSIIRDFESAPFGFPIKNFRKKVFPPGKVVSVGLSIRGKMNKPFPPLQKRTGGGQTPAKSDRMGEISVIEKEIHKTTGPISMEKSIRTGRIDVPFAPRILSESPKSARLLRTENNKPERFLNKIFEGGLITGRLWKPKRFGCPLKSILKVSKTPPNQGFSIPFITERKDGMNVCMCHRISMPPILPNTVSIRFDQTAIGSRMEPFDPLQEGRPEIKTHPSVVVDHSIFQPNTSIGCVTFIMNSLVPVRKGMRTLFPVDVTGPGILSRRLIKMTVKNERTHGRPCRTANMMR
jgi:hypothetical protein